MKKIFSILLSCCLSIATFSVLPNKFTSSAENEKFIQLDEVPKLWSKNAYSKPIDWNLWEKFLKYDLCITDYDALSEEEKELCKFIFETERSSTDTIRCERARRILMGNKTVGDRLTIEKAQYFDDIRDYNYTFTLYYNEVVDSFKSILHCVPDIKHIDGRVNINEYWLDDYGYERILTDGECSAGACYDKEYLYYKYDKSQDTFERELIPKINDDPVEIVHENCTYYVRPDNTLVLTSFSGESVEITSEIDGMRVVGIDKNAFANSGVSSVIFPDTLEFIAPLAFDGCANLNIDSLPSNIEFVGANAFRNCTSIGNLTLDCPKLRLIGHPFYDASINDIFINLKFLDNGAIYGYSVKGDVTFGDSVEYIDGWHFDKSVALPETVRVMSQFALADIYYYNPEPLVYERSIEIMGSLRSQMGQDSISNFNTVYDPLVDESPIPINKKLIINGWYGTEAHSYAIENNLKFNPMDELLYGDANGDNEIGISDAVAIQNYLLNEGDVGYEADLNKDGRIDSFDMIAMRKMLVES